MTAAKKPSNIHQRVLGVMDDLHYVKKEDKKVNGQYTFASHDGVTAALHPFLVKHRIVVIPTVVEHTRDGNLTVVNVEVNFVNADMPEDKITINSIGTGTDNQDKGIGKAVSYATKYAFLKVFVLETGDDIEKHSIDHKPDTTPQTQATTSVNIISKKQADILQNLMDATKSDQELFCSHFKVNELTDLPANQYTRAHKLLAKKQEDLNAAA